ncbi:Fungal specific transcription factor [Cadophora gregata]|uniref:Fungal specific transcription factor n=1 Tax=Cadophora gregata TaxID=51156 RepID=UPI0026DCCCC3|nr:Fungal specific transcription factor [Cadophora gregata]KAK0102211.1 Fungal specific transcription factor [Cadophora gregata]KAK0103839.1 Fungal specific transcription factor [Cadophora gregata f. sp. sojae]
MATNQPAGGNSNASNVPVNGWTRRDRPCDACRRRKSRCIIPQDTETCIMCQSRSEQCTFIQNPQRRKRRRAEDEGSPDAPKARSPDADKSIQAKPPIIDYTSLPGPSLLKQTLGLQNRQHGQYLGQTSEYDVRLINLSPFNGRGEHVSMPGTLRRVSPNVHFIMKTESQAEVDDEIANMDLVENIVQPHGRALVDLYFRIIHPSFPIFDKKVFLEKYGRTHREFTPPVLAAVYIMALNWWSYTPELVNLPKPDVQKLEQLVPTMMGVLLNRPKLSTVQAGLLLLQRPDGDSWALTAELVAVAQNLGLHLDCSKWKIPEWERSLRKRLAWGLFMQDKWGSLTHGRPSLIHAEDWSVRPVETRDFPETAEDDDEEEGSSDIETGRLTYIHMISLTEILTNILNTFFTVRAMANLNSDSENAMKKTLELAKPIQLQLKDWHAKLPKSLAIGETRARKLSPTGSLHLAYFAAEVTLHRAIIRFDSTHMDEQLRHITRNAAKARFTSAIEFVAKLEPAHLQSFWYFASKVNLAIIGTFGSLLWATSDNPEEADFYKSQLAEYRWTLRVSSKAAEFMKFTVGMLDSSPVFIKDGNSKTTTPNMPKEPPPQEQAPEPTQHDQYKQEQEQMSYGANEASPSVAASTENAFQYDQDIAGAAMATTDPRPSWSGLASNVNFNTGDIQDWSLDQLYNFENFQVAEEIFASRRFIEEYDETGNKFAGF